MDVSSLWPYNMHVRAGFHFARKDDAPAAVSGHVSNAKNEWAPRLPKCFFHTAKNMICSLLYVLFSPADEVQARNRCSYYF